MPGSDREWESLREDIEKKEAAWRAQASLAWHGALMERKATALRVELEARRRAGRIDTDALTDELAWAERQIRAAAD